MNNDQQYFERLILAWMHDPVDKALDIKGHISRAARYATMIMGREISETEIKTAGSDHYVDIRASVEDRLPLPNYRNDGKGYELRHMISFTNEENPEYRNLIRHPLSGKEYMLGKCTIGEMEKAISDFAQKIKNIESNKERFLALWRFLPDEVCSQNQEFRSLPAETRIPDHTIWNHLDLTAAFAGALEDGKGSALLSFSLGPVQSFIAQARSLRDLWSGSYLLSWLTFSAMQPVLEQVGPQAIIFPGLRGNPIFDFWLQKTYPDSCVIEPAQKNADLLLYGSLPNVFQAIIPKSQAEELVKACTSACTIEWKKISNQVKTVIEGQWNAINTQWTVGWDEQIESYWDIRSQWMPLIYGTKTDIGKAKDFYNKYLNREWPPAHIEVLTKTLYDAGKLCYGENTTPECIPRSSWSHDVELAGRLLAATKQIRNIPPPARIGGERPKCTLNGAFEQMGPGLLMGNQKRFWDEVAKMPLKGIRIRKNERLSAISLIKRFCWPAYFAPRINRDVNDLRFADTSTIAAREWLKNNKIDPFYWMKNGGWNGEWIFQSQNQWNKEPKEAPPEKLQKLFKDFFNDKAQIKPRPYYAVVMLDGDRMGQWLRGQKAPKLSESYHPKITDALKDLVKNDKIALDAIDRQRPLSPAHQAAITTALGYYSGTIVPHLIDKYYGDLIYSGGDDVLALLPVCMALECARALRENYSGTGDEERLLMGNTATASAGIVVTHVKTDLRRVLEACRDAENASKKSGRDAVCVALLKGSGENINALCPWSYVPVWEKYVTAFLNTYVSDRWTYQLRAECNTLTELPDQAVNAEIRRIVNRGEKPSRTEIVKILTGATDPDTAGKIVAETFEKFKSEMAERIESGKILEQWIQLIQTASFIARGRDK